MSNATLKLMDAIDDAVALARARMRQLTRRFDGRARRERVALLIAVAAVSYWLADKVWITPAFERSRAAGQQLAAAQSELDTLRADVARTQSVSAEQRRALDSEIAQWRQRIAAEGNAMRSYQSNLVAPDQMVELLEQLLPRNGRLRLVELQSLGRSELTGTAAAAAVTPAASQAKSAAPATAAPTVYRHGVELTVEGSYSDLYEYLQALEHNPRHVLWGGMKLRVEQYPKVVLTLRLYTLSLDRGWLEI